MSEQPAEQLDQARWAALTRILLVARQISAQATIYALALGAIAFTPEAALPALLGSLAANAISGILGRLAGGQAITDDEIRQAVRQAIDETGIYQMLTQDEFQRALARLARWQDLLMYAVKDARYDVLQCLAEQSQQYATLIGELETTISCRLDALATHDQQDEANTLLRQVLEVLRQQAIVQPPPSLSPLHQLPPPPPDFTGRDAELDRLRAALQEGGAVISGLRGAGGIGKTALALQLADELTSRYPDAQLFLDLKGTSSQPLSPADALAHVIRAYHPTADLPETEAELASLYHTILHGQRALLLMDNAANADQVRPLIPPRDCLLLVTSRRRFTLPGMRAEDLDALKPDDAVALLLRIAARISEDCATEIARLCGHLPLALRLAGSALAEHIDLDAADYLARLQDARTRLDLVDASISLTYDLLAPDLQRRWCALSVFPGTFDRLGAAAVWELEIDSEDAHAALSQLVAVSLVEWDATAARYRLHDLLRLFADSRLDERDRAAAQRRHAAHYARVAAVADQLYLQGGDAILPALSLFDLEWPNIQAGQAWAAAHADADDDAARLCSAYPDAAAYCLSLRQHAGDRIEWLEAALASAQRLQELSTEGSHLGNLGNAYLDLGQAQRALKCFEQALAVARQIGDRQGENTRLGNLGLAYSDLGQVERAIEHYEEALAVAREIGDRRAQGVYLGNLGLAYRNLGQMERAIEYCREALAIAREVGDRRNEAVWWGNVGLAHSDLGQARQAIGYYEQALVIVSEIGDRLGEGNTLTNLGTAYRYLGQVNPAIRCFEQALAIARETGDRRSEENNLGNLGVAYRELGQVERAITHYEQARTIARETADRRGEGKSLGNLGNAYSALGQVERAIQYYEKALTIAYEIGDRRAQASDLGNLGVAHCSLGQVEPAIKYHEQALEIAREIGDRRGEGADLGNLANAYFSLGQMHRAIKDYERSLAIALETGDRGGEGKALSGLGNAYCSLGNAERAVVYYEQALTIAREIGDRRAEGHRLGNLGNACRDLRQVEQAIECYHQALAIAREIDDRPSEGMRLYSLGDQYSRLGQNQQARECLNKALVIFEEIKSPYAQQAGTLLAALDAKAPPTTEPDTESDVS